MNIKFFYFLLIISIASCNNLRTVINYKQTKYAEINNGGVYSVPVVADLKVNENKVSASIKGRIIYGMDNEEIIKDLKNQVVAIAIDQNKADILIEPNYIVEIVDDQVEVTVTGRPGIYSNFRNIKPTDTAVIKLNQISKAESKSTSSKVASKTNGKNNNVLVFLGVILAIWVIAVLAR